MRRTWLIFSQTVTIAVALWFVVATLKPAWLERGGAAPGVVSIVAAPAQPPQAQPTASGAGVVPTSYSGAARRAAPAVVSVTAGWRARISRRRSPTRAPGPSSSSLSAAPMASLAEAKARILSRTK